MGAYVFGAGFAGLWTCVQDDRKSELGWDEDDELRALCETGACGDAPARACSRVRVVAYELYQLSVRLQKQLHLQLWLRLHV